MEYRDFIREVNGLGIVDETRADAAVLAVLGIFARMFNEEKARRLADSLPRPLSFDSLVGFKKTPEFIPFHDCVTEVAVNFGLGYGQALQLIRTVLRLAKHAVGENTLRELGQDMPPDWSDAVRRAA